MFTQKKYLLAVLGGIMVLTAFITSSCSSPPPKTPMQIMLEDYDFMVEVVKNIFPSTGVNKLVYGLDVEQKLTRYRKKITPETTNLEFVKIVDDALRSCKGNNLGVNSVLEGFKDNAFMTHVIAKYISREAISNTSDYVNALQNLRNLPEPSIELLYHDGAYYNKYDFIINGVTYSKGMKLLELDDVQTITQVKKLEEKLNSYDYKNKIFYGSMLTPQIEDNFYVLLPLSEEGVRKFTFEQDAETIHNIEVSQDAKVIAIKPDRNILNLEKTVKYLPGCKMIYIRLPEMNPEFTDFYEEEINKIIENESEIDAMVLDVRGNLGGGNDSVWTSVVSPFLPRTSVSFTLAIKNSPLANAYIDHRLAMLKQFYNFSRFDKTSNAVVPFIDPVPMFLYRARFIISNDGKGVMPVYLLTRNVYSSTGNLLSFARQVPTMTIVGNRNPLPLGMCSDPLYFSMPNIKVAFSVPGQIEITNCYNADQVQHTRVDAKVELTAAQMIDFINKNVDDLENFLVNDDPYFQKVIDLRKPKPPEPEKQPEKEDEKKPESEK